MQNHRATVTNKRSRGGTFAFFHLSGPVCVFGSRHSEGCTLIDGCTIVLKGRMHSNRIPQLEKGVLTGHH